MKTVFCIHANTHMQHMSWIRGFDNSRVSFDLPFDRDCFTRFTRVPDTWSLCGRGTRQFAKIAKFPSDQRSPSVLLDSRPFDHCDSSTSQKREKALCSLSRFLVQKMFEHQSEFLASLSSALIIRRLMKSSRSCSIILCCETKTERTRISSCSEPD